MRTTAAAPSEIVDAFAACGYDVSWRVVNARHWLPQFRERVFLVGVDAYIADMCAARSAENERGEVRRGWRPRARARARARGPARDMRARAQ